MTDMDICLLLPHSLLFLFSFIFFLCRHWLTSTYILFAVPYFIYDIYAMFMCYWYKMQVKGHEEDAPKMITVVRSYLWREFLMVLHHVVMVTVCFPVSVVSWKEDCLYFSVVSVTVQTSLSKRCFMLVKFS